MMNTQVVTFPVLDESSDGAYLGISIGNSYYTDHRLEGYLAWAKVNSPKFAFLIGDEIHAFTSSLLKEIPLAQARSGAYTRGDSIRKQIWRVAGSQWESVDIVQWRSLVELPKYQELLDAIKKTYESDAHFKTLVRSQVWANLAVPLARAGFRHERPEPRLAMGDEYVLHEVAGLIVVSEFLGFPVEIYPGDDLLILKAVYAGEFSGITSLLPESPKRKFLSLKIE